MAYALLKVFGECIVYNKMMGLHYYSVWWSSIALTKVVVGMIAIFHLFGQLKDVVGKLKTTFLKVAIKWKKPVLWICFRERGMWSAFAYCPNLICRLFIKYHLSYTIPYAIMHLSNDFLYISKLLKFLCCYQQQSHELFA